MATLRKALRAALADADAAFPLNIRVGHVIRKSMHGLAEDKGTRELRVLWVRSETEARNLLKIVEGVLGT
jgi:hypothetical protein